ncbi:MAG: hypothetical protein OES13_06465 [Acidimicrobiia bacterium]|nr:hypothetical protein [Acidimicrobiia bacterium]
MVKREFGWWGAAVRGIVIALVIAVTTVWLPSKVLKLSAVAESSRLLRDLIGSAVWGFFLSAALFGLWWAQRRGKI